MLHKFKLLRLRWLQALKSNSLALAFHRWIVWTQFELLILFYSPAATFRQSAASKHHPEPPIEKKMIQTTELLPVPNPSKSYQILYEQKNEEYSSKCWGVQRTRALRTLTLIAFGVVHPVMGYHGITGCVDKPKSGAPMLMLWFSCM